MAESLRHRGPDDWGVFIDEEAGIALANTRLSIIDRSSRGRQPMLSEDGGVVLVYNGELYNFAVLRRELEGLGRRFNSRCDTEVVLRSVEEWDTECVGRFDGMFAFAVWDAAGRRLLLARDPMGVKPLYYWARPGQRGVVFASELKALLQLPDFHAEVDRRSLREFLEFGYTFDRDRTILKGVRKLPPGHTLTVTPGRVLGPTPYFRPEVGRSGQYASRGECEQDLYRTLIEVVDQQLVADVPVGVLLSGGVDSSTIAALAARTGTLRTFTMAFANSNVDERPYARMVSRHIGSTHEEVVITPEQITRELEDAAFYVDDLFADWGVVTTRILYRHCREEGIKVVLVGEGADEIFGGYPSFRYGMGNGNGRPGPARLFALYRHYSGRRYGTRFWSFYRIMRRWLAECDGDLFGAIRLFESRNQLPNNYVMKVDRASMSVSVEARVPYLDPRVATLAYRIPGRFLLGEGTDKQVLRSMAERFGILPAEIARRDKYGASIAASWMDESETFRRFAQEVICARGGWLDELGLRRAMEGYFVRGKSGYRFPRAISIFRNLAWRLLLLCLWSRHYARSAASG